ncbi:Alpha-L-fucosidase 2 [Lasiodiplodia hormozganensis]|uniref:Alpha-L-fucosidase 2 n=1 Tax=Lasiodiplodia hormozganensis TaxID=869390 RepID=A0AA39XTP3_9PEZI|nr:Alpha-L-fucosidase 2 [Lasiodiplodia hormozganensis]
MYNCPGFMTHHNTDLWGDSAPVDNGTQWTMWPMGAAWLSLHLIEHYRFNGNKTWLEHSALPVLHEVADFYYCYLFNHSSGYYATGPSISPENSFRLFPDQTAPNATEAIDIAPTMDNEILWELFSAIVEAGAALGTSDDPAIAKAQHYLANLQPPQISPSLGTIMEWRRDYAEAAPGHRHVSHLFGLFPGRSIDPAVSPSLAAAANRTLHRRLEHGGAGTGWSRAWTISWFARLRDGDAAWENVAQFLNTSVNDNLFSNNPYPTFQADGNFGFVAGVVEMVLQSHSDGGVVHLLPALPRGEVQDGEVKGLVARGGFVVDVAWEGGRLMEATVESRLGNRLALRVADEEGFKVNGGEYSEPLDTVAGEKFVVSL